MSNFNKSKHYLGTLCKRGHDYEGTGKSLRYVRGERLCIMCVKLVSTKGRKEANLTWTPGKTKLSIAEVRKVYISYGCVLLEDIYFGVDHPMNFICSCGRRGRSCFDKFRKIGYCKKCSDEKIGRNCRIPYEKVKATFENKGCVLLSKTYKSVFEKLDFICSCGRKYSITYKSFRDGGRCPDCATKRRIKSRSRTRWTYELLYNEVSASGCVLITKKENYSCLADKIEYICSCGRKSQTTGCSFLKGKRTCIHCLRDSITGERSVFWKGGICKDERTYRQMYQQKRKWKEAILIIETMEEEEKKHWQSILDALIKEQVLICDLKNEIKSVGKE